MSLDQVFIQAEVEQDPELRQTATGSYLCEIYVRTVGQYRENTHSIAPINRQLRVTFWGAKAALLKLYLHRGRQIYLTGRLRRRVWRDKDGNTHTLLAVHGTDIQLIAAPLP